jgi:hypothetical protein
MNSNKPPHHGEEKTVNPLSVDYTPSIVEREIGTKDELRNAVGNTVKGVAKTAEKLVGLAPAVLDVTKSVLSAGETSVDGLKNVTQVLTTSASKVPRTLFSRGTSIKTEDYRDKINREKMKRKHKHKMLEKKIKDFHKRSKISDKYMTERFKMNTREINIKLKDSNGNTITKLFVFKKYDDGPDEIKSKIIFKFRNEGIENIEKALDESTITQVQNSLQSKKWFGRKPTIEIELPRDIIIKVQFKEIKLCFVWGEKIKLDFNLKLQKGITDSDLEGEIREEYEQQKLGNDDLNDMVLKGNIKAATLAEIKEKLNSSSPLSLNRIKIPLNKSQSELAPDGGGRKSFKKTKRKNSRKKTKKKTKRKTKKKKKTKRKTKKKNKSKRLKRSPR